MVKVHCAACFEHSGSHLFYLGETYGHNSLYPLTGSTNTGKTIEVAMTTLDETLKDIPITLLKIDAEGAETAILHGATQVIKNNSGLGIIVEYGPEHLKRSRQSQENFFTPFENLGFEMRSIDDVSGTLQTISKDELSHIDSVNLFFASPKSPLSKKL